MSTGTANVAIRGTAGEALTAGNCVYCSDGSGGLTAGRWYKTTSANTYSSSAAGEVGFASANISSAASGEIILAGRVPGLAGLTTGAIHYIDSTLGAVTNTAPTNARAVGVADSTSTLVVSPWALSAGTARFAGTLTSVGAFAASAAATVGTTLGVTGATTLSSTLSAGASTLASATITGAATVGTTLGVTGAATLSSTLSAGASTLASASITGAATVGTTLGVTGTSTVAAVNAWGREADDQIDEAYKKIPPEMREQLEKLKDVLPDSAPEQTGEVHEKEFMENIGRLFEDINQSLQDGREKGE